MTTWTKTSTGYRMGSTTLERIGRDWILTHRDEIANLGTRATFDDAEATMGKADR